MRRDDETKVMRVSVVFMRYRKICLPFFSLPDRALSYECAKKD